MTSGLIEKAAAARTAMLRQDDGRRKATLLELADEILMKADAILEANRADLARMPKDNPLYDRLLLDEGRLAGIASDMRKVASLPSPVGLTLEERTLPNGLRLRKTSVPYGVVGVIYEARPNVTFDVFSLCFKSGNVALLKGGSDADCTNRAAVETIRGVLRRNGLPQEAVTLLPATHEATAEMLGAVGKVDLVIPRGGRRLIDFVRDNAKVPCIETGAGVVNTYFDASGDLQKGSRIVANAKMRRVSVCNALDCLIIHSSRLGDLCALLAPMAEKVSVYADSRAFEALDARYPAERLMHAGPDSFGTEFMDWKLAVKTVDSLDGALDHIARYGSGHSEAVITEDREVARRFQAEVDAACVYVNAPTSFTDGTQFGLGAEVGISTQKLGARGPMGLRELTSYKWLIDGDGQTRP
ncbi:MAG: glutamate-5-semialdehyde dehydrogenase [Bacteroidales bacterium]|nr:glutamate-5-semialdehyde dehydrogenase [Bacteroidales bacterium]